MIEITISRTTLHRGLVIVPLGLLLLLGVIGVAVSPLVNGHPVILTRDRLALKHYLEEAQGWVQRLDDIAVRLDALSPALTAMANNVVTTTSAISLTHIPTGLLPAQVNLPSQAPLSAFTTPANHPAHLFDRAQAAEQVIQDLQALERDLQQIEAPVALTGLQEISTETVQTFATWSSQAMDEIGAPTPDTITATQVIRQAALTTLNHLRQALARQQGSQP
ncbi:MAG TPA: hypothetical protein VMP08_00340 [Anaerolineae bacterium]|nr:hypothetical protein [Anaerolineae bacterium]